MIVVKNGFIICPQSDLEAERDLLIEDGKIKAIDKPGAFKSVAALKTIDANGCWVIPGMIDLHVHLREPGFEWKETIKSGSEAAVLGGFTSICCMPNTNPTNDSAQITQFILDKARAAGRARVLPIGAITASLKGGEMAPLSDLQRAGCVAFSDDGEPVANSGIMRRALEWCLSSGLTLSCHEEDKHLSCGGCMNESPLSYRLGLKGMPKVAEEVMIARDIELARTTGGRVHICHISSGRSAELIRRAKNDGISITCEVTPHHITLDEEAVATYDTNAKMSPPLREAYEVAALRAALKDGTIDAIASDHAPHELDSKRVEFSRATFGILGLQTSLPLILDLVAKGEISRRRAIDLVTAGPARAFGLPYGTLKVGMRADVSIIDPAWSWSFEREGVKSLSFNSPFFGRKMVGISRTVIVDGQVVVDNRELL